MYMVSNMPSLRANIHDLHQAVITGTDSTVQEILDLDSVSNINATVCGSTALSLSLYREKFEIFKLILCHHCTQKRLDINKLSKDEKMRLEPPLITACRLGNGEAMRLLISFGANLEALDDFGHTALWVATRQRNSEFVSYLLNMGAQVSPSDIFSHSPLYFAVRYSSKRSGIAKTLLRNGARVTIRNSQASLVYIALSQGDTDVGRMIVEAGFNPTTDQKLTKEIKEGSFTRNPAVLEWMHEEINNPAPLQRQCRTRIRQAIHSIHLGVHFRDRLAELPLPKSILWYLAIEE